MQSALNSFFFLYTKVQASSTPAHQGRGTAPEFREHLQGTYEIACQWGTQVCSGNQTQVLMQFELIPYQLC